MNDIAAKLMEDFFRKQKLEKVAKYNVLNKLAKEEQILFVGSSLMEFFPVNELMQNTQEDITIYNRGIAGFVIDELMENIDTCIFDLVPSKIFINIGSNDVASISKDFDIKEFYAKIDNLFSVISERLKDTKVYVMKYYPVNPKDDFNINPMMKEHLFKTRSNKNLEFASATLNDIAVKYNFKYIDANAGLIDEDGNLHKEFSTDGVHMYANAYAVILNNLMEYIKE